MKLQLAAFLLFAVQPAIAAGYTLDECLATATGKNPDLLREKAALDENQAGYVVSRGALLPQLDATLSYQRYDKELPNKKVLFGTSLDDYYSDLTIKQLLFSGGKYMSQLRSSKVSVEAQKQRLSLTERDLAFNVTKAYYEQLRAAQTLEIQKSVLEKLSQQRVAAQLLYNGGRTSVVDVLKIQTNESAQRDAVANAENQVYVKALALGQAMGVEEPVWANFAMPQSARLRPGMAAEIELAVAGSQNSIVLPQDALVVKPNGSKVVFVIEDSKAVMTKVETGIEANEKIEITKGLKFGQAVAVAGQENLKDGAQVKIAGADKKPEGKSK